MTNRTVETSPQFYARIARVLFLISVMAGGFLEFLKHLVRFKRHVYLDHNATTNVSSHVQRTMNHVLKYFYGNPSSLYGIALSN